MYRTIGRLHRTEQHTRTKISMVCITGLLLSLRVEMNADDSFISLFAGNEGLLRVGI